MQIDAAELEKRRPIWEALSELFLDEDDLGWERAANVCARSPYSAPELQCILFREVYPHVAVNLTVAGPGVWTGFDQQWLEQAILSRTKSRLWPPRLLWRYW
jgi:hypothetical protein